LVKLLLRKLKRKNILTVAKKKNCEKRNISRELENIPLLIPQLICIEIGCGTESLSLILKG
jgi:hypothetical protein